MKIAIVHDYLNQFGGAERVIQALHELYPEAPIYTSIYNADKLPESFRQMDIRTSYMQHLPLVFNLFKLYWPFYPSAFEGFDLSEYEVILSSSSAFAKGVRKNPQQLHICYCYTPARFLWRYHDYVARESFPAWLKAGLPWLLEPLKKWDLNNCAQVDFFVAISHHVAERIKKIYDRESDIIYPPVDTELFKISNLNKDYFLLLSRLNAYKRVDLVIDAFNQLKLPLKVVGDGPLRRSLEAGAQANIEFLGRRPDNEIADLLAQCRALIFPGEEDFGIVPLEAQASGRPVIAYNAGGAKETIVDGETGLFFTPQTAAALSLAVQRCNFTSFDKLKLRQNALRFDKKVFQKRISEYVQSKYQAKFDR